MPKPNTRCVICKKPIYRIPSRICDHNTCSIACRNTWFSKEKHPKWKDGCRNPERTRATDRARRALHKQKAIEKLGGKCCVCGYNRCIAALDFHHKDPLLKDSTIKDMLHYGWKRVEKELEKCILVCANCHRELHWRETHEQRTND